MNDVFYLNCRINNILYGTPADSQEAVYLLKQKSDVQTLCLLITSFKKYCTLFFYSKKHCILILLLIYYFFREIQTLKESNKDLENKFTQRVSKYMELKRHLCEVNSKESMNTRVIEYVIYLNIFILL